MVRLANKLIQAVENIKIYFDPLLWKNLSMKKPSSVHMKYYTVENQKTRQEMPDIILYIVLMNQQKFHLSELNTHTSTMYIG